MPGRKRECILHRIGLPCCPFSVHLDHPAHLAPPGRPPQPMLHMTALLAQTAVLASAATSAPSTPPPKRRPPRPTREPAAPWVASIPNQCADAQPLPALRMPGQCPLPPARSMGFGRAAWRRPGQRPGRHHGWQHAAVWRARWAAWPLACRTGGDAAMGLLLLLLLPLLLLLLLLPGCAGLRCKLFGFAACPPRAEVCAAGCRPPLQPAPAGTRLSAPTLASASFGSEPFRAAAPAGALTLHCPRADVSSWQAASPPLSPSQTSLPLLPSRGKQWQGT